MKIRTLTLASMLALLALLAGVVQPTLAQPAQIPARSTTYVVQAGDSWVTISKKYGVSASRLIDLN
nr:LysM peptidoglycan-binding domain-containing protein [Chloroflexota bacterium]